MNTVVRQLLKQAADRGLPVQHGPPALRILAPLAENISKAARQGRAFIMTEDLTESTVYGSFFRDRLRPKLWLSAQLDPINVPHLKSERVQFFRPCARCGPVRGCAYGTASTVTCVCERPDRDIESTESIQRPKAPPAGEQVLHPPVSKCSIRR